MSQSSRFVHRKARKSLSVADKNDWPLRLLPHGNSTTHYAASIVL
jgi:hypothetical protein